MGCARTGHADERRAASEFAVALRVAIKQAKHMNAHPGADQEALEARGCAEAEAGVR
jgi:hypothetical protein